MWILVRLVRMRAARLHEPRGAVTIGEIAEPSPGEGEILVRVQACGLCHSDLFIQSLESLPRAPVTLGHEAIGVVEQLGPGVADIARGDRVGITYLYRGCGQCGECGAGRPELCARQVHTGYDVDGAFGELAVAHAAHVARVPEGIDAVTAAPLCCAGWTAYRAVKNTGLRAGEWLAVFGVGGLGHLGIQFARLAGLRVAAVDVSPEKLALAEQLGADLTINAANEDPSRVLRKQIGGVNGAVSFVAAATVIRQAFGGLRRGAALVLVGLAVEQFELPLVDTIIKSIRVQGSFLGRQQDLAEVFELARAGKIRIETESRTLDELPAAFEDLRAGRLTGRAVVRF
jgi:propanol-preferring alcohol dehydrogenase